MSMMVKKEQTNTARFHVTTVGEGMQSETAWPPEAAVEACDEVLESGTASSPEATVEGHCRG